MLDFFVRRRLWRSLKGPLQHTLHRQFSTIGRQLRRTLSTALDDLGTAIVDQYILCGAYRHQMDGRVWRRGGDRFKDVLLRVNAIPIDALLESTHIRQAVAARLRQNVSLDALRNRIGISNTDWSAAVDQYSRDLVRFGTPIAVRRLARARSVMRDSTHIIDVADGEPIRVNGGGEFHDLMVLCDVSNGPRPWIAARRWRQRDKQQYELSNYSGFKAV